MRQPPRILIVDDQPVNVDILQTRLAIHGYEILTAGDGEEALARARAEQPNWMGSKSAADSKRTRPSLSCRSSW
jgi:CheY-like chemotaxis protein